jgi:hypothetical protein
VNLQHGPGSGDAALGLALPTLSWDFLRGYRYGSEHGWQAGYAEGDAWLAGWLACFSHFADMLGGRIAPERPTQLEILRWGPGGRTRFGDRRPGDYPGQGGDAA